MASEAVLLVEVMTVSGIAGGVSARTDEVIGIISPHKRTISRSAFILIPFLFQKVMTSTRVHFQEDLPLLRHDLILLFSDTQMRVCPRLTR